MWGSVFYIELGCNLDISSEEKTSVGVFKSFWVSFLHNHKLTLSLPSAQCSPFPELRMQSDTDTLAHECDSSDEDYVPDSDMELESELEDEVEDFVHSDRDTKYLVLDQQLQQLFKRC